MARRKLEIAAGGAICSAFYFLLAWDSHDPAPVPLTIFTGCMMAAAVVSLVLLWRHRGQQLDRSAFLHIVAWAVLFRVIGFFGAPLYEDDYYRYMWDGRSFAVHGNPYAHAPADAFGDDSLPATFEPILSRINYPEVKTIYGPTCQLAFLAAYWIAPGALWPLKLIFIAFDLGIIILLRRMAAESWWIIVYAWCPLVIKEVGFTAHTDVLTAFFLLAAVYLIRSERLAGAGISLALAVAAKVVAIVAVPVLLWRKRWWAAGGVFAATLAILYVPFALTGGTELSGLATFSKEWEFNSFAFAALRNLTSADAARGLWVLVFAAFYLYYVRRSGAAASLGVILAVFLVLSPVVNPWYLIVLAPFAVIEERWWLAIALQTVLLSYWTAGNMGRSGASLFDHPAWVRPLELAPVVAALLWTFSRKATAEPKRASDLLQIETKGATP